MNIEIANAVGGYFETLYDVNVKLIKLCGMDALNFYENDERLVLDIMQDVCRLFPYKYDKKKKVQTLDNNGGLLEFKDTFDFLEKDFYDILKDNDKFLDSIRQIRNKYEHKMHSIKIIGQGSGSLSLFDFDFIINKKHICLSAGNFIKLLKQLNYVYSKIQSDIDSFAQETNSANYAYHRRLSRFNFNDFSKIYDDSNLRLIGKLIHTF